MRLKNSDSLTNKTPHEKRICHKFKLWVLFAHRIKLMKRVNRSERTCHDLCIESQRWSIIPKLSYQNWCNRTVLVQIFNSIHGYHIFWNSCANQNKNICFFCFYLWFVWCTFQHERTIYIKTIKLLKHSKKLFNTVNIWEKLFELQIDLLFTHLKCSRRKRTLLKNAQWKRLEVWYRLNADDEKKIFKRVSITRQSNDNRHNMTYNGTEFTYSSLHSLSMLIQMYFEIYAE